MFSRTRHPTHPRQLLRVVVLLGLGAPSLTTPSSTSPPPIPRGCRMVLASAADPNAHDLGRPGHLACLPAETPAPLPSTAAPRPALALFFPGTRLLPTDCKDPDTRHPPCTRNPDLQLSRADLGTAFSRRLLLRACSAHRGPSTAAHRLAHLLVLPRGRPRSLVDTLVAAAASTAGFHVLSLSWPNWGCRPASGVPACMDANRTVVSASCTVQCYAGPLGVGSFLPPGPATNPNNLTRADSIVSRVAAALQLLAVTEPSWAAFLTPGATGSPSRSATVRWGSVTVVGHSLGADMAVFVSKQFAVARAVALAGPNSFIGHWDWFGPPPARGSTVVPAPWVVRPGKTPGNRLFVFGDLHGRVCTLWSPAMSVLGIPGAPTLIQNSSSSPLPPAQMMCVGDDFHTGGAVRTPHGAMTSTYFFWIISHADPVGPLASSRPPHARRVICYAKCPC